MDETMLKMCGGGMLPMIDFEWNDKLGNLKGTVVIKVNQSRDGSVIKC